jgi:predicted GIY-YIG superfamily endonuclease
MTRLKQQTYFVYILYCPLTHKSYVGQTSHLLLRFHEHRNGDSRWTKQLRHPLCVHW